MSRAILKDQPELIFVYNAKSGLLNLLADAVHKIARPETYPCRLCAVTYGLTGMRSEWKAFLRHFGYPFVFLHRDELARCYGITDVQLPAVFIRKADRLRLLIGANEINQVSSLNELIDLLKAHERSLTAFAAQPAVVAAQAG